MGEGGAEYLQDAPGRRQDGGEGIGTGGRDGAHVAQKEWVEGGILAGVEETPHVCSSISGSRILNTPGPNFP